MKKNRSQLTDKIIDTLRGVNDEISYDDLSKRVNSNQADVKKYLPTARKALLNEKILFEPIIGYGLKRLNDSGKVLRSQTNKRRLRSGSKRSLIELDTIHDYNNLNSDEQILATVNRTLFELILKDPEPPKKLEIQKPDLPLNVINIPKIKT